MFGALGFVVPNLLGWRSERIDFLAEYSAWSGPVTWISIGVDNQNIKVGIDFSAPYTRLWKAEDCPPFIDAGCYDSTTSFMEAPIRTHFVGRIGIDRAALLGLSAPSLSLVALEAPPSMGLVGLDVAGFMGASPRSWMLGNRIIQIQSEGELLRFLGLDQMPPYEILMKSGMDEWSFQGELSFLGHSVNFDSIVIDLAVDDVHIPRDMANDVLADPHGRVLVECNVSPLIELKIGAKVIIIPLIRGQSSLDPEICETFLVLRDEIPNAVIGRRLMSSVKSVVLNFKRKQIALQLLESLPLVPTRFIPMTFPESAAVFSPHFVQDENSIVFRAVASAKAKQRGLVLRSWTPKRNVRINSTIVCGQLWVLERVNAVSPAVKRLIPIFGSFDDVSVGFRNDSLEFKFLNFEPSEPPESGFVILDHDRISLCKTIDTDTVFGLKNERELFQEGCVICLQEQDDGVRSLKGCIHRFHKKCLTEWLVKGGNGCPICRHPVGIS